MRVEFEQYVEQFVETVIHANEYVDYSNKSSVRKHNKYVDRYRKIAKAIYINYPNQISDFSNLQRNDNSCVRICCAVCIVELMNPSLIERKKAIDTVVQYIEKTNDEVEKAGFEIWLKKHPL